MGEAVAAFSDILLKAGFQAEKKIAELSICFASTSIGLVEENSGINVLEIGVEGVSRACSHAGYHDLVLNCLSVELLAALRQL